MGKTLPTFRNHIENCRTDLAPFKRAMKPQNKELFDQVFNNIRYLSMPAKATGRMDTDWLILFNLCVGQQREIRELRERLNELENRPE